MRAIAVQLCLLLFAPVVGANYETGDETWRDIERLRERLYAAFPTIETCLLYTSDAADE